MPEPAETLARRSALDRFLNGIETAGNKLLSSYTYP